MKALLSIALIVLASCSTYYDVRFVPAPLETRIGDGDDAQAVARALVTVLGVRKADSSKGEPARVEMRMRVENLGSTPLEIEPDSFQLVAANLASFAAGQMIPPPQGALASGASCEFDLLFPLPAGQSIESYDVSGLNLRWATRFGDRRVFTGASFQRAYPPPYYYDDPWYPHVGFGVGVGVTHVH